MRIEDTDARKRRWNYLVEATGERAKSKAIDRAAKFYLKMRGDTTAHPCGAFDELLDAAEECGSLEAEEIAEILNTDELPVRYEVTTERSVGPGRD